MKKAAPASKKPVGLPASHTVKPAKGEAAKVKAEAGTKMTPAQWETSATDAKMDRAGAAKSGQTMRQYEDSPADRKADAKNRAAHNAKAGISGKR